MPLITMQVGTNGRRGIKARPDRQLSWLQRQLCVWLVDQEAHIKSHGTPKEQRDLNNYGIRWHAKVFFDSLPEQDSAIRRFSRNRSAVSQAVSALTRRELLQPFKTGEQRPRTTHIRLTPDARRIGQHEKTYGMSSCQREKEELNRALAAWHRERDAWQDGE